VIEDVKGKKVEVQEIITKDGQWQVRFRKNGRTVLRLDRDSATLFAGHLEGHNAAVIEDVEMAPVRIVPLNRWVMIDKSRRLVMDLRPSHSLALALKVWEILGVVKPVS